MINGCAYITKTRFARSKDDLGEGGLKISYVLIQNQQKSFLKVIYFDLPTYIIHIFGEINLIWELGKSI